MNISEFKEWRKENYNFMTPKMIDYTHVDDKVILELSASRETRDKRQYGVSVIVEKDGEIQTGNQKFSQPFYDKTAAVKYMSALSKSIKQDLIDPF